MSHTHVPPDEYFSVGLEGAEILRRGGDDVDDAAVTVPEARQYDTIEARVGRRVDVVQGSSVSGSGGTGRGDERAQQDVASSSSFAGLHESRLGEDWIDTETRRAKEESRSANLFSEYGGERSSY